MTMCENTTTVTNEKNSTVTENKEKELKVIDKAIFVLFAEFLGYVSPLIDWAEDICDCKNVPEFKKKIVYLDADYLFKEMQKEYTIEEIRKWYDEFYPVALKEYADKMKSDLPF